MQKRKYGLIPQESDPRDKLYSVPRRVATALPKSVDLRKLSQLPAPYDQGQLGSCTANAIAFAFWYGLLKNNPPSKAFAPPFMPSRLFIYYGERSIEGTVHSDSGAEIRDGIKVVNKLGVCPETECPYVEANFTHKPTAKAYKDALKNTASGYEAIDNTDLEMIKGAVAENLPVVMGFTVYSGFESDAVAKTGVLAMPTKKETALGGHAVAIVGYDDALYGGHGGFIVRNSWGSDWGQQGYFTMPYAYATDPQLASDFWVIKVCS